MKAEDLKKYLKSLNTCICIREPRGDYGLEGFQINETYYYKLSPSFIMNIFGKDKFARNKLLDTDFHFLGCATKKIFCRYFKDDKKKNENQNLLDKRFKK